MFIPCLLLLTLGPVAVRGYPSCDGESDRYGSNSYGGYGGTYGGSWYQYDEHPMKMKKPCEGAKFNPRGYYTAHLAACKVQFHKISAREEINTYEMSTRCSDDNLVDGKKESTHNTAYEYMSMWKDECVGDFRRCYIIPRDEKVFKDFLCSKNWTVPEGTTHISVDCRDDKNTKIEALGSTDAGMAPFMKHQQSMMREVETILVVILTILLVMLCACCGLTYRWAVKPYQQNLRLRLAEHRALLNRKKEKAEDDDDLGDVEGFVTGGRPKTDSSW